MGEQILDGTQDAILGTQVTPQGSAGVQLFSQAQVSNIVSQRVNGLNQRIADLQAQLDKATKRADEAHARLTVYSQKETATKLGIPEYFTDFAIFSANQLVTAEKTFDTALSEWWGANKGMLGTPSSAGQAVQAGAIPAQPTATPTQQAGVGQPTAVVQPSGTPVSGGAMPTVPAGTQTNPVQYGGAGAVAGVQPSTGTVQGTPAVVAQIPQYTGNTSVVQGGTGIGVAGNAADVANFIKSRYGR